MTTVDVQRRPRYCPSGHGALKPFITARDGYGCNLCSTRYPAGTTLYSCRKCDGGYDECHSCYATVTATLDPRPLPLVVFDDDGIAAGVGATISMVQAERRQPALPEIGTVVSHEFRGNGVVKSIDSAGLHGKPITVEFASGEVHRYSVESLSQHPRVSKTKRVADDRAAAPVSSAEVIVQIMPAAQPASSDSLDVEMALHALSVPHSTAVLTEQTHSAQAPRVYSQPAYRNFSPALGVSRAAVQSPPPPRNASNASGRSSSVLVALRRTGHRELSALSSMHVHVGKLPGAVVAKVLLYFWQAVSVILCLLVLLPKGHSWFGFTEWVHGVPFICDKAAADPPDVKCSEGRGEVALLMGARIAAYLMLIPSFSVILTKCKLLMSYLYGKSWSIFYPFEDIHSLHVRCELTLLYQMHPSRKACRPCAAVAT